MRLLNFKHVSCEIKVAAAEQKMFVEKERKTLLN
jgi:hypothetical protein